MDSEAYSKTIEKMMHSDNVSPIMKKVLEKEMHRAKSSSKSADTVFTEEEVKEMNEWMKEEKSLIDQVSEAIQSVEKGLKDGLYPTYLRPIIEKALPKMKSIRDRALKNLKDMKKSEGAEGIESIEEVKGVEGAKKVGNERVEAEAQTKSKTGVETEPKSTSNSQMNSNAESGDTSDFMKSLKQSRVRNNDFFVFLYS